MALKHGQSQTQAKRLDTFDNGNLRKMEGIDCSDFITNDEPRMRTGLHKASRLARGKTLWWYGHLTRIEDTILAQVYQYRPKMHGWKRPLGQPRTRWKDGAMKDAEEIRADLAIRAQWRRAARECCNCDSHAPSGLGVQVKIDQDGSIKINLFPSGGSNIGEKSKYVPGHLLLSGITLPSGHVATSGKVR